MFQDPQAFLALPFEARDSELRHVIEETLSHHGVTSQFIDVVDDPVVAASIQDRIRRTDFVIADVSGANPNVMFEVGLAFGMGKPILLLSNVGLSELPFNLAAQQVAKYRSENLSSVRRYVDLWLRDVMTEREARESPSRA